MTDVGVVLPEFSCNFEISNIFNGSHYLRKIVYPFDFTKYIQLPYAYQ